MAENTTASADSAELPSASEHKLVADLTAEIADLAALPEAGPLVVALKPLLKLRSAATNDQVFAALSASKEGLAHQLTVVTTAVFNAKQRVEPDIELGEHALEKLAANLYLQCALRAINLDMATDLKGISPESLIVPDSGDLVIALLAAAVFESRPTLKAGLNSGQGHKPGMLRVGGDAPFLGDSAEGIEQSIATQLKLGSASALYLDAQDGGGRPKDASRLEIWDDAIKQVVEEAKLRNHPYRI